MLYNGKQIFNKLYGLIQSMLILQSNIKINCSYTNYC